jgi:hypothetical protein
MVSMAVYINLAEIQTFWTTNTNIKIQLSVNASVQIHARVCEARQY